MSLFTKLTYFSNILVILLELIFINRNYSYYSHKCININRNHRLNVIDTSNIDIISKQHNFPMPKFTLKDEEDLKNGLRIQKQQRYGRSGYGSVVIDVPASVDDVFNTLINFNNYNKIISTVKSVNIYNKNNTCAYAEFCLSRFYLKINVIHTIDYDQKCLSFQLDKDRANPVIRFVDGFWHLQEITKRDKSMTRIWFNVKLEVSSLVPNLIVDYAACRALPKATVWLLPYFSKLSQSNEVKEFVTYQI